MTASYFLEQAGRKVEPGSGGRHRADANRSEPAAHAVDEADGVEVGRNRPRRQWHLRAPWRRP